MRTHSSRKTGILAVLAIAGSLAIVAIVAGPAASGAVPSQSSRHGTVLHLTTETSQDGFVDVGSPGPGLGDQIVSSDTVFRNGKAVGTDGVVCTVVKATPDALTCQWLMTMDLPGGQLTMQGIADGPTHPPTEPLVFALAITGGTGLYRDATGVAEVVDNPAGREDITVRLSR